MSSAFLLHEWPDYALIYIKTVLVYIVAHICVSAMDAVSEVCPGRLDV